MMVGGGVLGVERLLIGRTPLEVVKDGVWDKVAGDDKSGLPIVGNPNFKLILPPAEPDLGRGVIGSE